MNTKYSTRYLNKFEQTFTNCDAHYHLQTDRPREKINNLEKYFPIPYTIVFNSPFGKQSNYSIIRRKKWYVFRAVLFAHHFSPGGIAPFSYRILILRINNTRKQADVFLHGPFDAVSPNRHGVVPMRHELLYLFRRYPPTPLSPGAENTKMYFSRTIRGNRKSSLALAKKVAFKCYSLFHESLHFATHAAGSSS